MIVWEQSAEYVSWLVLFCQVRRKVSCGESGTSHQSVSVPHLAAQITVFPPNGKVRFTSYDFRHVVVDFERPNSLPARDFHFGHRAPPFAYLILQTITKTRQPTLWISGFYI